MQAEPAARSGMPAAPLPHEWIAARIPHHGAMCLLDSVLELDADRIVCSARSHADPANPLRAAGRLAAVCGIEYAAQAMAAHGAALRAGGGRPALGYLASVRKLAMHVERLDNIAAPLRIEAERAGADGDRVLYLFTLSADGRCLLEGRAAVLLEVPRP